MDIERLEKLQDLRDKGIITEEEFQAERAKAIQANAQPSTTNEDADKDNNFGVILHLSQFAGWVVPLLGFLLPIILWQSRKDNPLIDQQGRAVTNWLLSSIIYFAVSFVLTPFVIGFFMLFALVLCNIIFVVIGAVKAGSGVAWKYPLSIPFFNVKAV